jgi:hypothetical protein
MNQTMIDFSGLNKTLDLCLNMDGSYKTECLARSLCQGLDGWIIKGCVILIMLYIVITWLSYWFAQHDMNKNENLKVFLKLFTIRLCFIDGHFVAEMSEELLDLSKPANKYYWIVFFKEIGYKVTIGFIVFLLIMRW